MSNITPKKAFIVIWILIRKQFNGFQCSSWKLTVKRETFTYSTSVDLIIRPDPSLIQLSILLKTSWKDLFRLSSVPITVLIVELK